MSKFIFFCACLTLLSSCDLKHADVLGEIMQVRDSLKQQYAPDQRVALFQIEMTYEKGKLTLTGQTDQPRALTALEETLKGMDLIIDNQVLELPDESVDDTPFGVINNSVGNIRSNPKHSAELATQAILGTEVKVLQIQGEWYRIQTPDGYISWIDHGGVALMTADQIADWRSADKVIVTTNTTTVVNDGQIVSDAVLGSTLKMIVETSDSFQVQYPDGRLGEMKKSDGMVLQEWKSQLVASGDLIEKYALAQLGSPYLWGGTSTKGLDCSGFTKTVYFMNGLIIPRDASQQINAGEVVDAGQNFERLQKGDLLFFGRPATDSTRQKVTHVGIWLDSLTFIHSSMRVKFSSFDPQSAYYDEFNLNRYLAARRYLGAESEGTVPF